MCLSKCWCFFTEMNDSSAICSQLQTISHIYACEQVLLCSLHTIITLASVHYTDMKPLVNSYIQKLGQTKSDVAVHGRDLYLVKPTLGPPIKFQHLTRAEEVVITRLRIDHTKATKSHILSRGPPTGWVVTIVVKH